jgi:hypothetical protein
MAKSLRQLLGPHHGILAGTGALTQGQRPRSRKPRSTRSLPREQLGTLAELLSSYKSPIAPIFLLLPGCAPEPPGLGISGTAFQPCIADLEAGLTADQVDHQV